MTKILKKIGVVLSALLGIASAQTARPATRSLIPRGECRAVEKPRQQCDGESEQHVEVAADARDFGQANDGHYHPQCAVWMR